MTSGLRLISFHISKKNLNILLISVFIAVLNEMCANQICFSSSCSCSGSPTHIMTFIFPWLSFVYYHRHSLSTERCPFHPKCRKNSNFLLWFLQILNNSLSLLLCQVIPTVKYWINVSITFVADIKQGALTIMIYLFPCLVLYPSPFIWPKSWCLIQWSLDSLKAQRVVQFLSQMHPPKDFSCALLIQKEHE